MSRSSQTDTITEAQDLKEPLIKITADELKANKARGDRSSVADVMIRTTYLSKVEDALKLKLKRPASRQEVLNQMRLLGFDMSLASLWRDRGRIKTKESWLRDLLEEGTYSAYQSDTMELLDYIIEKSIEFLNQKWTASKEVLKLDNRAPGPRGKKPNVLKREQTITADQATPKYNFLNIMLGAVKLRKEMLGGANISLATAALEEDFQKLKDQYFEITSKNKILESEVKALTEEK